MRLCLLTAGSTLASRTLPLWKKVNLLACFFGLRRLVLPLAAYPLFCLLLPLTVLRPRGDRARRRRLRHAPPPRLPALAAAPRVRQHSSYRGSLSLAAAVVELNALVSRHGFRLFRSLKLHELPTVLLYCRLALQWVLFVPARRHKHRTV